MVRIEPIMPNVWIIPHDDGPLGANEGWRVRLGTGLHKAQRGAGYDTADGQKPQIHGRLPFDWLRGCQDMAKPLDFVYDMVESAVLVKPAHGVLKLLKLASRS